MDEFGDVFGEILCLGSLRTSWAEITFSWRIQAVANLYDSGSGRCPAIP